MLVELFQRLFGATRDAIALPHFDAGNRAVEISATILRECIDLGAAWPDGPNRERLSKPFARGYIFGFSDACIQRFGVLDELESLALTTAVHAKLFGRKVGSLLVHDALRDERNAEFGRGRAAGAEGLLRWLDDRSNTPLILVDYLYADDEASSPTAATGESPAESGIQPTNVLTKQAPSRWNNALVRRRAIAEATPDKSAVIIRLRTRSHVKTVKPIKRDEH
ncbi:MAG TPA: hypothetical protein VN325_30935 [Steroidobacteraceae bacterium]|nr:hypothetical protein [Steroidobacteraceae bacterium]